MNVYTCLLIPTPSHFSLSSLVWSTSEFLWSGTLPPACNHLCYSGPPLKTYMSLWFQTRATIIAVHLENSDAAKIVPTFQTFWLYYACFTSRIVQLPSICLLPYRTYVYLSPQQEWPHLNEGFYFLTSCKDHLSFSLGCIKKWICSNKTQIFFDLGMTSYDSSRRIHSSLLDLYKLDKVYKGPMNTVACQKRSADGTFSDGFWHSFWGFDIHSNLFSFYSRIHGSRQFRGLP